MSGKTSSTILISQCLDCGTFYRICDAGGTPGGISHGYCSDGCLSAYLGRQRWHRHPCHGLPIISRAFGGGYD